MAAAARARQPDRMRLIGVLMAFSENDPAAQSQVAAFRGALNEVGVVGRQQSPDRTSLGRG